MGLPRAYMIRACRFHRQSQLQYVCYLSQMFLGHIDCLKLMADKEANSQNELFLGSSTEPLSNKILTNNNQNITVTMSLKNKNNKKIDRIGVGFSSFDSIFTN